MSELGFEEVVWSDPPEPRRWGMNERRYEAVLAALQGRPGVWAQVRGGLSSSLKKYGCEVTERSNGKGQKPVTYARWPLGKGVTHV